MKNTFNEANVLRDGDVISEIRADLSVSHDAGEDVTLPDYYPEIGKIVSVSARVLPESKFVSDSGIEAEGSVSFNIYYIGEDGKLTFAPALVRYAVNTQLPPCDEAGAISLDTRLENYSCRATAKRKLNLKARLRTRVLALEEKRTAERVSFADSSSVTAADLINLEKKPIEVQSVKRYFGEGTVGLTTNISLDPGDVPIGCDGSIAVRNVRSLDGSVQASGDVFISVIVLSGDGKYKSVSTSIPFEDEIASSGVREGDICRAWGRCTSVSIDSGEGSASIDVEADLEAEVCRSESATATLDAFSSASRSEAIYTEIMPCSLIRCRNASVSVSASPRRKNSPLSDEYIIASSGEAVIERCDVLDGRLTLSGSVNVKVMLAGGGDAQCEEFSVPFKYEFDGRSEASDVIWRADAFVSDLNVRATSDGEGDKMAIKCEVCFGISAMAKTKLRCVGEVKLTGRNAESGEACVTIAYPDDGEDLWDISKRYGVSPREIARLNQLDEVCAGRPILIL